MRATYSMQNGLWNGMRCLLLFFGFLFSSLLWGQLQFIPNTGQWEDHVKFMTPVSGGRVWSNQQGLRFEMYDAAFFASLHPNPNGNHESRVMYSIAFGKTLRPNPNGGAKNTSPFTTNIFWDNEKANRWSMNPARFSKYTPALTYTGVQSPNTSNTIGACSPMQILIKFKSNGTKVFRCN